MNEKLQYASMLEIPVSTCTVKTMPIKRKRTKKKKQTVNPDLIKEQLFNKINENQENFNDESLNIHTEQEQDIQLEQDKIEPQLEVGEAPIECEEQAENQANMLYSTASVNKVSAKKGKRFKISVIGVQFVVIGLLALTILLTSAIFPNSGINVFFSNVFSAEQVDKTDNRVYSDFTPVIAMGDNQGIAVSNGIISFGGTGSVYSPCDGVVTSILKDEQGKYMIEVTHGKNFKSILEGIEHAYVGLNDNVYFNIPVGYLSEADGATMCFTDGQGSLISGYELVNNTVAWEA